MNGAAYQRPAHARYHNFHGPKKAVLGHPARQVPPAWRPGAAPPPPGSKIFISHLPTDVGQVEVEELFKKTVGPLRDAFLVYNSQGHSKGMAVVTFQRKTDAALARAKYHGKVVDGRRPITIEIIVDDDTPSAAPAGPPSLFDRIGGVAPAGPAKGKKGKAAAPAQPQTITTTASGSVRALEAAAAVPPRRVRHKKGARRLQKRTREELDQEMEDYRAAAGS
ncbi:hypothetical protein HDZ31DRAFT_80974 [Schizophyllum fasciatum]